MTENEFDTTFEELLGRDYGSLQTAQGTVLCNRK
jgi:hypothetical protein